MTDFPYPDTYEEYGLSVELGKGSDLYKRIANLEDTGNYCSARTLLINHMDYIKELLKEQE